MRSRQASPSASSLQDALRALQAGQPAKTVRLARKHLKKNPGDPAGHHVLGAALYQQGKYVLAADSLGKAVAGGSADARHYADWGLALKAADKPTEALDAYDKALSLDPAAAGVWNDRGIVLNRLRRFQDAVQSYEQSLALNKKDAKTHINLSTSLLALGRVSEAVAASREAVALAPGLAPAHNSLGSALARASHVAAAITSFQEAVKLDSACAEALGNLASLYEETSKLADARDAAERALNIDPDAAHAVLVLAKCERRDGAFDAGVKRLETLNPARLSPALARDVAFEQSRLHDRLGNTALAFAAMEQGNRHSLRALGPDESPKGEGGGGDPFLDTVSRLRAWAPDNDTEAHQGNDGRADPVFLTGFPRSGTTLLGQILGSHPDLMLIEERPMLDRVITRIKDSRGGYPDGLNALTTDDTAALRDLYFTEAARETATTTETATATTPSPEKRIVDKFPLHLINLGLIKTLFPQTRVIFALRHPCDVVLSCFMQNFRPNPAMANFFSIERAAMAYDRVMGLKRHYDDVLTLGTRAVRYEDVVADFDTQVSELLAFLELPWQDSVRDYARTARQRGRIDTPSYHQVTEAIYTRARYRWRRYEQELEPVMETLQPWITAFGYDEIGG